MNGKMNNHEKSIVAMRYWLLGKGYYQALEAMEWLLAHHKGVRKDGVTPEIVHQMSVVYYLKTIHDNLLHPEETLCAGFLHDSPEDLPEEIPVARIANTFGPIVAAPVRICNRFYGDEKAMRNKKDLKSYYIEIGRNDISSIVKSADRIHNVQTMIGVFTKEKQREYVRETEEFVIPMIKDARRRFPRQEPSYENAKHLLRCQIELIKAIHGGKI